jgi:hypothetical protein
VVSQDNYEIQTLLITINNTNARSIKIVEYFFEATFLIINNDNININKAILFGQSCPSKMNPAINNTTKK